MPGHSHRAGRRRAQGPALRRLARHFRTVPSLMSPTIVSPKVGSRWLLTSGSPDPVGRPAHRRTVDFDADPRRSKGYRQG